MSVESRGQAFLTLVHHILENKTFINDFTNLDQKSPNFPYSPRFIDLVPNDDSPTDVDTPDELKFAMEMRRTRVMTMQPLQANDTKQSSRPFVSGGAGSDNGSGMSISIVLRTGADASVLQFLTLTGRNDGE